jgi:hypothetical protein
VVALGITALLPLKATLPIPWSILTLVAPDTSHVSVEDSPTAIVGGSASNDFMTGDSVVVVTVSPVKSQPAVHITTSRSKGINFFMLHLLK